jgi:hypothetical protein
VSTAISFGSILYVRYKDHVLYRNNKQVENPAERETVGWLTQQTEELLCIQHDRTVKGPNNPKGTASGLLILKSCILEVQQIPLQNIPNWTLNSQGNKETNVEYALQPKKRKTQPK